MEFVEGLQMTEAVASGLEQDGITTPTSVQRAAIAPILAGRHVIIDSATGTGKTLAYLLPILQRLLDSTDRAVVLAPTVELAMQTLHVAERYKEPSLKTGALVSSSRRYQEKRVQKSTRLIVGTPGRILEAYKARKLKRVTTVVLDEPDPILSGGDASFLRSVLTRPDPKVQVIFAAATMGPRAEQLVKEIMGDDHLRTAVDDNPLQDTISHHFVSLGKGVSFDVRLASIIKEHRCERAIVFANEPATIRHLFRFLGERGLRPVTLSQERSKGDRREAIASFARPGGARMLVTTDIAARGLDLPGVSWIFHYDLPLSAQAYVHRAGRTGRVGQEGRSVVLISENKRFVLDRYARQLGIEFIPLR